MTYKINGKTYIQKPLVLGQIGQLVEVMQGLSIKGDMTPFDLMRVLGDRLNSAIAVVLREDGKLLKDKDIEALTAKIEESIDAQTQLQVVQDFFQCNPISFLLETLPQAIGEITAKITEATKKKTGSERSSASSQKETSPEGTISSGDTPLTSADLT